MFAASFGSYNFYNQPDSGTICVFSLKNCCYPEYVLSAPAPVLSIDFHPSHPYMMVAGLQDGNVAVYNLIKNRESPVLVSDLTNGKHSEIVWSVTWSQDDIESNLNFFSCSADGGVTQWTVVHKTILRFTRIFDFTFNKVLENISEKNVALSDGVTVVSFCPSDQDSYYVGTEDGYLHMCTVHYSSTTLLSYRAHNTPVRTIAWNCFIPETFLTVATEMSIKIWRKGEKDPLFIFELKNQVSQSNSKLCKTFRTV